MLTFEITTTSGSRYFARVDETGKGTLTRVSSIPTADRFRDTDIVMVGAFVRMPEVGRSMRFEFEDDAVRELVSTPVAKLAIVLVAA